MKIMITREDNDSALDEAHRELEQLMEGRMTNLRKPKPAAPPVEELLEEKEPGEDEIDENELEAVLSKLG